MKCLTPLQLNLIVGTFEYGMSNFFAESQIL